MMKISSILSIVLLIAAIAMTSVSARTWKVGNYGAARWDYNCDFNGHDIRCVPSNGEQCGGICVDEPSCTHFTYYGGTCCIKRIAGSLREQDRSEHVCGFLPGRSAQPL